MSLRVAFTGRATGMTDAQRESVYYLVEKFWYMDEIVCGHNDGVGADQEFATLCRNLDLTMEQTDASLKPMPRNRELVRWCQFLIGCPPTDQILKTGSGTWETIKYGWKYDKIVFVVLSTGHIVLRKEDLSR